MSNLPNKKHLPTSTTPLLGLCFKQVILPCFVLIDDITFPTETSKYWTKPQEFWKELLLFLQLTSEASQIYSLQLLVESGKVENQDGEHSIVAWHSEAQFQCCHKYKAISSVQLQTCFQNGAIYKCLTIVNVT